MPSAVHAVVEGGPEGKQGWRFSCVLSDGRRYEERLAAPTLRAWLSAHLRAFESFAGVPTRIELVTLPSKLDDEVTRRAWADLLRHYLGRPRASLREGLLPLPERPYIVPAWKQGRVHPDCHVVFEGAYYSAPYRLIGRRLLIRGSSGSVDLFDRDERVAHHARALRRGSRQTHPEDYPPRDLAPLLPAPRRIRHDAERVGLFVGRLVDAILDERPVEGLRGAQGVVHLARRFPPDRLEAACRWALSSGQPSYRAVRYALKSEGADHAANRSPESASGDRGDGGASGLGGEPPAASRPA